MNDKSNMCMYLVFCLCLSILSCTSARDRARTHRLEAEIKAQGEAIVFLYECGVTNKVNIEAFISHVKSMEERQDKISAAIGDAIAIIGKEFLQHRQEAQ